MRLIDADALMEREKVNPFFVSVGARNGKSLYNACLTYMAVAVGDAPTIDAVPVVRCKDCWSAIEMDGFMGEVLYCKFWGHDIEEACFCSYGERKDGEG